MFVISAKPFGTENAIPSGSFAALTPSSPTAPTNVTVSMSRVVHGRLVPTFSISEVAYSAT